MDSSKIKVCQVESNEKPLISIIVPVFNAEKHLDKCIKSLINQTYEKIEIILIDDGSTDKSLDVCLSYKQKDSRIYYFHQENQGVSAARNRGIKEASGDYIAFVDADDWIDLSICEIFAEANALHDYDLFCYSAKYYKKRKIITSHLYANDIDFLTPIQKKELQRKVFTPHAPDFSYNVNSRFAGSVCGKFYKRKILLDYNLLFSKETTISEDCLFNTYALDRFERIGYTKKSFYHYIQQEDSAQNRYRPNSDKYFSFVIKQIQKWLKTTNKDQQFIDSANTLFVHYLFGILKEDLFHKNNQLAWINRKKRLNQILIKPEYCDALQCVNRIYFSFSERLLLFLLKKKMISVLKILISAYNKWIG